MISISAGRVKCRSIKTHLDCNVYYNLYCHESDCTDEGKQQGLGSIGGMADTYWGKNKGRSMEGVLVKATTVMVVLFMVISAVLCIGSFN